MHRPRTTYMNLYYKAAITWSAITSGLFNARYYGIGYLFDHAAASLFLNDVSLQTAVLGFLNTNVCQYIIHMLNPTMNTGADIITRVPIYLPDHNLAGGLQSKTLNCPVPTGTPLKPPGTSSVTRFCNMPRYLRSRLPKRSEMVT